MGSPENEAGRFDNEGPLHRVRLTRGFWLAEVPCTQRLWAALRADNPSRFVDPDRPVERVTWHGVQAFLGDLGAAVPGLEPRLPTEAEWEYACRAGTTESTYAGPMVIRGANDAPVLDAIAWYGGNSGGDYELEEAHDARGWPARAYPDPRAGTRKVASKAPNTWGLFDTLGNVLEWCADGRRDYGPDAVRDPVGPEDGRVFRGGAWSAHARNVRAASRDGIDPTFADDYLGFRLARSS